MHTPGSVLVVYADQAGELPLEQLAFTLGEAGIHAAYGIHEAIGMLGGQAFSFLIIDIGHRGPDVLSELDELARHCDPEIRVVVAGRINDVGFYRELRQRGVMEYFAYPVSLAALRDTLNHAHAAHFAAKPTARKGFVAAFLSAASGDGSSTLAINTAYALAHIHRQPTVLVDMDYQFGMIARQLDLHASFGIRELFEYPDRGVDATLVAKMLCPYGENLKVIASPVELKRLPQVGPALIRDLMEVLREEFSFIIIDMPHLWADWTGAVMAQSDHLVVVTQLWLRSLTHLARQQAAWREIGISKDEISLVVNRSGAKYKESLTKADVERISGKPVDFLVSNDIKTVVQAENQAKTVMEIGHTPFERQIGDIAKALMQKAHKTVEMAEEVERKGVSKNPLRTWIGKP